ncbi:hypothetical protein [Paenarthrobacter sp. PH39-S1]|uniref:GbsR/MarR family transcriptional regulator n=1 Tax=Paenarthrobacter sp. PH39-S1 TaxID=3046204 RepID=UPI0024B9F2EB|nr:hypothetical protein [Paenarthrobacter sp. PH39-S1]MDJ0356608.1 hypothetical protein [Paenarthrobacter sp. PH39-S1]
MDNAVEPFVERFADVLTRAGWPRMSARIFAALMVARQGSLSAADLAELLEVGASAISNGAKMLRALDLVEARRQSDRQVVYRVRPDAWMAAVVSQEDHLRILEDVLNEGASNLEDGAIAYRLRETASFFGFLRVELAKLVRSWRDSHGPSAD